MRKIGIMFILLSYSLSSHAENIMGHVIEVTSGDKLIVLDTSRKIHKVRLLGIDAPESSQPFAKESRNALFNLVYDKKVILYSKKNDASKVLIGKLTLDNKDINLQQIKKGMAWVSNNFSKELSISDQRIYVESEFFAKNKQVGLWLDQCPVEPWVFREKCCPKQAK